MACGACQKARTAFADVGSAIVHGDARKAAKNAAQVVEALREKAQSEAARVRAMIGKPKS